MVSMGSNDAVPDVAWSPHISQDATLATKLNIPYHACFDVNMGTVVV